MKKTTFLSLLISLLLWAAPLKAAPTTANQAEKVVRGWLRFDAQPLGASLGQQTKYVETFSDANGQPTYYVVYLQPTGFVIVPADDLVEPIVAFVEQGIYDPSPDNPLGALVSQDLPGRIAAVRDLQVAIGSQLQKKDLLDDQQAALETASIKAQIKWAELQDYSDTIQILGLPDISDVWVAPLVQSKWGQTSARGGSTIACYNYYTPPYSPGTAYNYPCGCVATAMAQVMRFHEHPTEGIGVHTFTITVDGNSQDANTLGGNGQGGPYNWDLMVLDPVYSTLVERQAIGALCYDAGVAANMNYSSVGSAANRNDAKNALIDTFGYSNAISVTGGFWTENNNRINPNLDAGYPVMLSISEVSGSHAVVCDGYGYDFDTLYHHINMGWRGSYDAWYNLPYVYTCFIISGYIYNIFPSGSGEIISGRVTDIDNETPISGVTVSADTGSQIYDTNTNDNGIYALAKVPSSTTFIVSASKSGYTFLPPKTVTTGDPGNKWGVDFQGKSGFYPIIQLSADNFEFTAVEGGLDPEPQILSIWNCGFETLNWEIAYDCNWLDVDPTSGSSTGEPNEVTLSVNTTNLIEGSYNCELTIAALGALNSPQTVQIALNVSDELYVPGQYPTIQAAIDAAVHGCTVIVAPDIYTGPNNCDLDFNGKSITVRSTCPNDPNIVGATIIDCNGTEAEQHYGFYFHNNEDANSILDGFTITNAYASSGGAVFCESSDPTIMNCIMRGNFVEGNGLLFNGSGGGVCCLGSNPTIINCLITGNQASNHGGGIFNLDSSPTLLNCTFSGNSAAGDGGAVYCSGSSPTITNCILWGDTPEEICAFGGTPVVTYSDVQGGFPGIGNINVDPCFADTSSSDPNKWDYRLQSHAGRWDPNQSKWVTTDANTSTCIDAGDPNSDWTAELWPHGKRINMGAFGGTSQASMSLSDVGNIADLSNNSIVYYTDLMMFTHKWLCQEVLLREDLDRDGIVNFADFAIFAENWLWQE